MPHDPAPGPDSDPFAIDRLSRDLATLLSWGPRSIDDPATLAKTEAFLCEHLTDEGYLPLIHRFDRNPGDCNILAECPGADPAAPVLEIGAHFDTVAGSPGADDNGSGVVGLLAIARHFAQRRFTGGLRFCFFGREETGQVGSGEHQRWLDRHARPVAGCVVFEMIGYRTLAPNSQRSPFRIPLLLWPPRTGDFIAVLTDRRSRRLAKSLHQALRGQNPVAFYPLTAIGGLLKDAVRSDHAAYWRAGRPAVMLTDTANFRNPHYHRPSDTLETVDFAFLADIAAATAQMAEAWAEAPRSF